MNVKALSLGALLGLFFALVPSCGPAKCGPQNCNGCCDATGQCVPRSASNSNTVCGTAGNTCSNCAAMGMTCDVNSFVCVASGTGGGSAMGGGAGGGSATGGGAGGGSATGGGAGGGSATGGGAGGGSATGGGGGTTGCNFAAQTGCGTGEACLYSDANGNTACFAGGCDLVAQVCPTTTDSCTYVQFQDGGIGRGCLPSGTGAEGSACSSPSACAKGLLCLSGKCAKFCYRDSDCTGANQLCATLVQVPGANEIPAACTTINGCDPLLQNCTTGEGCYLTTSGPVCAPQGSVALNGTCTPLAVCTRGALCLVTSSGATSGTCKAFCNLDGGMPNCGSGACGALQGVSYGYCP